MNKKKSSPWIPLIVALVACASFISSSGDEEPAIIFASIAVVLVITLAVLAAQKAKAKKTEARNGDSIPDDPRMKTFTKPDAPCVVCEHTGEDHLARDKQNRIRQLDDWLKSGLIDRAEYAVLAAESRSAIRTCSLFYCRASSPGASPSALRTARTTSSKCFPLSSTRRSA